MWNASRFCVSSLRRGHANLLCIVPILVYVLPKQVHLTRIQTSPLNFKVNKKYHTMTAGFKVGNVMYYSSSRPTTCLFFATHVVSDVACGSETNQLLGHPFASECNSNVQRGISILQKIQSK